MFATPSKRASLLRQPASRLAGTMRRKAEPREAGGNVSVKEKGRKEGNRRETDCRQGEGKEGGEGKGVGASERGAAHEKGERWREPGGVFKKSKIKEPFLV